VEANMQLICKKVDDFFSPFGKKKKKTKQIKQGEHH
jgi:hypothetical protein